MNKVLKIINSTPGRKAVMALTGLFFCAFLIEHLYTNLLLYKGDGGLAFVEASHNMTHSLLIRFVEIVLFAAIMIHAAQALYLTIENRRARPVKYVVSGTGQTSSWFSRNMGLTGLSLFAYVAAWEFKGVGTQPVLHKEELKFESIKLAQRSYK